MRRVVVTGIGALTPIGNNYQAYIEGLKNGVSGANDIRSSMLHYSKPDLPVN